METYKKSKFWFLNKDGTKKEPQNGDSYFVTKVKLQLKFPFIVRSFIRYELIENVWVEKEKL